MSPSSDWKHRWKLLLTLQFGFALVACGADPLLKQPVDFRNDVMPVFSRFGCNSGACHGSAKGRGGFRLSLFGSRPDSDYDAIVKQLRGRRVNLSNPEKSLLVLKPTEQVEHGGGTVLELGGNAETLLSDWIRQGAKPGIGNRLVRFEVLPGKAVIKPQGTPSVVEFKAFAEFSDGTRRDVTEWTLFEPADETALEMLTGIERKTGKANSVAVRVRLSGRHVLLARYLDQITPVELIVPYQDKPVKLPTTRVSIIDRFVNERLMSLGLSPSPQVDDSSFLRRVSLDLTGRLPNTELTRSFLRNQNPDKRKELIDEFLESDAFVQFWTMKMAKLLRVRSLPNDRVSARVYHEWLSRQIEEKVGWDQVTRNLLTSTGDTHTSGPANFFRMVADPREQAELMSEVFMGSRLRCANCHNHPLDRWTQDDYHGLAAIFAKVKSGKVIEFKPNTNLSHPETLEKVRLRIPGDRFIQFGFDDQTGNRSTGLKQGTASQDDPRKDLANWLVAADNPYFSTAIVNRLWAQMMGRGLIEPVDDMRQTNPPTHPQLLKKLSEEFAASGFDIREILRRIANSETYARSTRPAGGNAPSADYYSVARTKRLEPEVFADAISDVLGVPDQFEGFPLGTRAVELFDPSVPSRNLDVLGRCDRKESCESESSSRQDLAQTLHFFNGSLINSRLSAKNSRLHRLRATSDSDQVIRELYLAAYSRYPSVAESDHWKAQLVKAKDERAITRFYEDLVWSILNSREFTSNH